jgi:hypothetical protein
VTSLLLREKGLIQKTRLSVAPSVKREEPLSLIVILEDLILVRLGSKDGGKDFPKFYGGEEKLTITPKKSYIGFVLHAR